MFAVDDDIESSPKFEALDELPGARGARAFAAWGRLGAACRKRGNGGFVSPMLLAKILHAWSPSERAQAVKDLVDARGGRNHGLLVLEGNGWRFHQWEAWQPSVEEASHERTVRTAGATRTRRWRMKKASRGDADTPSHGDVTRDGHEASPRDAGDVSRARDPVPSRPVPSKISSQNGDLDLVARAQLLPTGSAATELRTEQVRAAFADAFRATGAKPVPPWVNGLTNDRDWGELRAWLVEAFPGAEVETAKALGDGFARHAFARRRGWPFRGSNGSLMHGPGEFLENGHAKPSSFDHVKRSALDRLPEDSR